MGVTVDWCGLVFETGWLQRLDKMAARRFGVGGLAEEASTYVINRLTENDWAVLRKFQGQSKPATYLYTVVGNFLEEFSRARFGRPRPPEWVKREGDTWVQIWRAVCLERHDIESIIDRFSGEHQFTPTAVRKIAKTIKARALAQVQGLREFSMSRVGAEEESVMEEDLVDAQTPDRVLARAHYDQLLSLVAGVFDITQTTKSKCSMRGALAVLGVSPQEAEALSLVYQEGHKRNAVAHKMGVAAHVPGRMINKAMVNLRRAVEARGGGVDIVREQWA